MLSCRSFTHRNEARKTEEQAWWLFWSTRLPFTCSHLNHPTSTKSVSHLSSLHFCTYECSCGLVCAGFVCVSGSVRSSCVPMCVYVWLGQLILSARKCPAARIWSGESVCCSVDTWRGARTGTRPLSISMAPTSPNHSRGTARSRCRALRETPYCQKQVWDAANKKISNCQKPCPKCCEQWKQ